LVGKNKKELMVSLFMLILKMRKFGYKDMVQKSALPMN